MRGEKIMLRNECRHCKKSFVFYPKKTNGMFCSRKCNDSSEYKRINMSLKMTGKKISEQHKKKISVRLKGNKYAEKEILTYNGLHDWVRRKLGKPNKCEKCGTEKAKMYDWANISKEYRKELSDWRRLCRSCHIEFDKKIVIN